MNFLKGFFEGLHERQVKFFARGLSDAMSLSALVAKRKYPNLDYYSDYAKLALETRLGWKRVGDKLFQYKNGVNFTIDVDQSLYDVIQEILVIELLETLKELPIEKRMKLISVASDEIAKYYSK
ncbi:MAG: hypothetical protein HYW37_00555 [Candidatus Colwellbacteria bacterium]|nr:hypothetical protein [Candidatus Colwellbacteria bacterium]